MDRFRRGTPTPIKLTERDLAIFRLLNVHRVLNSWHIAQFLGIAESKYYQKRLKDLYDNRYLDRITNYGNYFSETGSDKIIYALANEGAKALREAGDKLSVKGRSENNNRLKVNSLKHDLLIVDFLATVLNLAGDETRVILADEILAGATELQRLKKNPLSMNVEFNYLGEYVHKALVPDGLFAIEQGGRKNHYLLEIDTGSENQTRTTPRLESILRKMKGYTNVYRDKIFFHDFNVRQFQVLFVTSNEKRMNYMIDKVFNEYIAGDVPKNVFLFTTFDQVNSHSLDEPIWLDCNKRPVAICR